ncbi:carboxylesterase family protein [Prevotella sp.]|uniref:carboxylesterase family protein n=1 Tax=Prevotella sp. TaxID=59823 RepID=UPI002E77BCA4|nr:hypothetical protein [Prevotella sp.]MEE0668972.1 hypothetical protein [Prevotella sp.]
MSIIIRFLVSALLALGCVDRAIAQTSFSKESFTATDGTVLPYRKASIPGVGDKASLVIYLHGGSSKGDDNETQLQEPGVNSITEWLTQNNRKAIMVVPQCAKDKSWIGDMLVTVKAMLQTFVDRGVADNVYIFGGSMGGTGTWNMLSLYPNFFAAAMPVAGNPSGLNAENVAQTPLFTVMGTADRLMKIPTVESFLADMDAYNAEYRFETEEGWSHEDTCKKSYTKERLNWVFSHKRNTESSVIGINANDNVSTTWFSLDGQRLNGKPQQKGIYIKKCADSNGQLKSTKIAIGK